MPLLVEAKKKVNTKVWTYSPYRAMLRLNGKNFAIVTPDGRNALSKKDSAILLKKLNA